MNLSINSTVALSLSLLATVASAQTEDRAERWRDNCERGWNNGRARFCELRTYTISPATRISVDGEIMAAWRSSREPPGCEDCCASSDECR